RVRERAPRHLTASQAHPLEQSRTPAREEERTQRARRIGQPHEGRDPAKRTAEQRRQAMGDRGGAAPLSVGGVLSGEGESGVLEIRALRRKLPDDTCELFGTAA